MVCKIINDRPAKISEFECTTFGEVNERLSSLERTKHFLIQKQKKDLEGALIHNRYEKDNKSFIISTVAKSEIKPLMISKYKKG